MHVLYGHKDRRQIAEMRNEEKVLLEQRDGEAKTGSQSTIAVIVYGIPLAIALLTMAGFYASMISARSTGS